VRITRQLADVLHNYFSIDAVSNSEVQDPSASGIVNSKEKAVEGSNSPAPSLSGNPLAPGEAEKKLSTRDRVMTYLSGSKTASDKGESGAGGGDKLLKTKSKDKEGSNKDKEVKADRPRDRSTVAASASNTGATVIYSGTSSAGRQEGLYIRYLRVGDIQVDVSLSGFPLNVENYRAVVEPFFCRGEVLQNWQRLIYSFERHASRSLIRNTASSSLTRLSNFFSFSGTPRPDGVATTGDKIVEVIKRTTGTKSSATQPDPDEEKKRKVALLLGGSSI
jgi:hypothetical protein